MSKGPSINYVSSLKIFVCILKYFRNDNLWNALTNNCKVNQYVACLRTLKVNATPIKAPFLGLDSIDWKLDVWWIELGSISKASRWIITPRSGVNVWITGIISEKIIKLIGNLSIHMLFHKEFDPILKLHWHPCLIETVQDFLIMLEIKLSMYLLKIDLCI